MKVKTVIALAARLAEREDLAAYLKGTLHDADAEREIERLRICFGIVERDIASNYLPIVARESGETADGIVRFSALQHPVLRVLRVEGTRGELSWRAEADRIETERGAYAVTYCYPPAPKELDDCVEIDRKVPPAAIAYGVVCEYYLMSGLYREAAMFEKRYRDCLAAAAAAPKRAIRGRKWV